MYDDRSESGEIFEQIQTTISGHTCGAVLQALLDSLSATLAFMVDDLSEADAMIDILPADMKRDVRQKWSFAREQRALALRQGARALH
jgi:hypothetical protein